nr:MAG TPA: hypothetical protein [Caudoviricetes sp.]
MSLTSYSNSFLIGTPIYPIHWYFGFMYVILFTLTNKKRW